MLKKGLAINVAAALILGAPGLGAYEALAAMGVAPVKVVVPVGGNAAGAAGAGISSGLRMPMNALGMSGVIPLGGSLATVANPVVAPNSPLSLSLPLSTIQPGATPLPAGRTPRTIPGGDDPSAGIKVRPGRIRRSTPEDTQSLIEETPDSLQSVRSRSNTLGLRFKELRSAFKNRSISDEDFVPQHAQTPGSASRYAAMPVSGRTFPFLSRVPGLKKLAAPTPLALKARRGAADMRVEVEPQYSGVGRLGHMKTGDGGLFKPEDFGAEVTGIAAQAVQAKAKTPGAADNEKSAWLGLGKVAVMLIASLVVAQIGIESLGAAMPSLIQKTFGDFTAVAQLAIVSSIASIIGRQLGPLAVRRFSLKNTYLGADTVRLVSISLLAGLLATGNMSLLMMGGFYAINGVLAGISLTALESIPPAIVGRETAKLEKFWTWQQTILEMAAIVTPILTGSIVASMGFLPALIAFPVAMGVSLVIVFMTLRIPKRLEQLRALELTKKAGAERGFFGKLAYGAKLVWQNKPLRYSFLAYTMYVLINPLLYTMLAPAFGLRLMPTPELAASVQGWLTGLYSMGGLFGGLLLMWEQWRNKRSMGKMRAEAEANRGKISDADWAKEITPWQNEKLRKSMLTWLLLGAAGLSMLVPLAFPLATLGQMVALPSFLSWASGLTVQAAALIFFGIAQVISVLKLRSFFQSRVPATDENGVEADNMPDAMGFFGSASMLVSTLGLLGLKALFQNVAGFAPFLYLAWGMIPLGAFYLYLRWRLNKSSLPQN